MNLSDFNYVLPKELIATEPLGKRDESRLLVLNKTNGDIKHRHFFNILDYLQPGDLLIANNSQVIPARLIGRKPTGGAVEIFLSKNLGDVWECLIKGRVASGAEIILSDKLRGAVTDCHDTADSSSAKIRTIRFNLTGHDLMTELERIGQVPLPPYIIRARQSSSQSVSDKTNYQTVYADEQKKGSVAAPTAGLHFTPELMAEITAKGAKMAYVTLHVGLGTFLPVTTTKIEDFKIHSEWAEVSAATIKEIMATKAKGGRIIAVGTTAARTLEYVFNVKNYPKINQDFSGWVDIFIYPPYEFQIIDGLITNFHLPKSTLLMLVSALVGKTNLDRAYQEAIKNKYRFYSYGDAMLII